MHHRKTSLPLAVLAVVVAVGLLPNGAAADENCCLNNFRFAGGCMVVARGSETCSSVLAYLNNFDSVGKYYCGNTTVRGGWTLTNCSSPAQTDAQTLQPQSIQQDRKIQQSQPSIRSTQPQTAPAAKDANLLQVSAPLQVQFDNEVDTSSQGAGTMVTGTLQTDLMDGETVIAPAGSQVQAQIVPTSYWSDGSGDAYEIQATAIQVGDTMVPVHGTAVAGQGGVVTTGAQVKVPKGSTVSFDTTPDSGGAAPAFDEDGSRWMEAFNDHDAQSLSALYAADAALLPPNEPAVFGSDAIRASFEEIFAGGDFKIELEALETVVEGPLAYVAGRYRMWTDDGTLVDRGKYVEIWRPVDGTWMMSRDIWNSSVPLPTDDQTD